MSLYNKLLSDYGEPSYYWPQWCSENKSIIEREKIIIGTILVQRTSWHNANIALKNLKALKLLSVSKIAKLSDLTLLTKLIRPSGFFQTKPERLFDVCTYVENMGGVKRLLEKETLELRIDLLKIKGVGKETADTILLYALDKPVFIIDEYTYRWAEKHNLLINRNYDELQNYFQTLLQKDVPMYQKFHSLIIISQKDRERSVMEIV